jgi:hypothetical protein
MFFYRSRSIHTCKKGTLTSRDTLPLGNHKHTVRRQYFAFLSIMFSSGQKILKNQKGFSKSRVCDRGIRAYLAVEHQIKEQV